MLPCLGGQKQGSIGEKRTREMASQSEEGPWFTLQVRWHTLGCPRTSNGLRATNGLPGILYAYFTCIASRNNYNDQAIWSTSNNLVLKMKILRFSERFHVCPKPRAGKRDTTPSPLSNATGNSSNKQEQLLWLLMKTNEYFFIKF